MFRIRLLPIVMVGALCVLGLKVDQLRRDWLPLALGDAQAKSSEQKADASASPGGDKMAEAGKAEAMAKGETGKSAAMADQARPEMTDPAKNSAPPLVAGSISKGELEVLQSLADRRETLERRNEEIRLRENLMAATEKRVDDKIAKLKSLESQIKELLRQHDKEREEQLKSLVKVYETMKPKDAARIFEQLEMDILLQVTGRMREAKMAPVLAAMNSERAKELTVKLATQYKLPKTGDDEG